MQSLDNSDSELQGGSYNEDDTQNAGPELSKPAGGGAGVRAGGTVGMRVNSRDSGRVDALAAHDIPNAGLQGSISNPIGVQQAEAAGGGGTGAVGGGGTGAVPPRGMAVSLSDSDSEEDDYSDDE